MTVGRFQCGIAAVIYHAPSKTYLLLRRSAARDYGAGDWESVTGRVDQGEGFEEAVHREVLEELGVNITVEFIIGTSHFYRGDARPENELLAIKYACAIEDREMIKVSDEHSEHRWLTAAEIFVMLPQEHWLYRAIQRAELMRIHLPPELLDIFRREGFS